MAPIIHIDDIAKHISIIHQLQKKIILTGGCFDVIHPGHIAFLSAAKKLGGELMVMLESDESIRKYKGPERPIHTQQDRALVLAHIREVDAVICLPHLSTNDAYGEILETINPDYIAITKDDQVKQYLDIHTKKIPAKIVEVIDRKNHSSSSILAQLKT
jgi:rfaE bifunctional protein nucleotidyltransferase chain/domain